MRRLFIVVFSAFLFSCAGGEGDKFRKSESGLEYKIIRGGCKGCPEAGSGATVKIDHTWYRGDSIWQSSRNDKPFYQQLIPGLIMPYHPFEALVYGVKEGDSVAVRLSVDSLVSQRKIDSLPAGTKKGDAWIVGIKVLKIFPFDPLKGDSIVLEDKRKEGLVNN